MEIFIAVLAGLAINAVAFIASKLGAKTDIVVVIVAVLLGIGYTAFEVFIPVGSQEFVLNFVSKAMTTSWLVWQFLIKPMNDKIKINGA